MKALKSITLLMAVLMLIMQLVMKVDLLKVNEKSEGIIEKSFLDGCIMKLMLLLRSD